MIFRVEAADIVPSTQDIVRERARTGEVEGLVIRARQQVAGRGRHGRQWTSPPGNLYQSILLKPRKSLPEIGQLSFVAAVAMARTIEPFLGAGHALTLKWPNDILIDDRKMAGILLESEQGPDGAWFVVVGTGVNIDFAPPDRVCLRDVSDAPPGVEQFQADFLRHLSTLYDLWHTQGFAPIRDQWMDRPAWLGRPIEVIDGAARHAGFFAGIDDKGCLVLGGGDNAPRTFASGEIMVTFNL